MTTWTWLTKPKTPYRWRFAFGVVIKGLILFALLNVAFALLNPMSIIGRLTVYNWLVPGRLRLPYGENPNQSYNLSLQNLDAMFAAHEINGAAKADDEFRVLLVGDSAVWGVLLDPADTLAGQINAGDYRTGDGRRIRAYNLGYPVQSLPKDLLILNYGLRYQPDLVMWLVTPESFAPDVRLSTLLVRENPALMRDLIARYGVKIDPNDAKFIEPDFFGRTIIGQRRAIADWLRLQLYGLTWQVTRHDQTYPRFFEPRKEDFDEDVTWHGFEPGQLTADDLAFDVISAGVRLTEAAQVPIILINEPMFISSGRNSNLRYNFFYPRWVADSFREWMTERAGANQWVYLDLWNTIPAAEFTDSAVHLTPAGSRQLAAGLGAALVEITNRPARAQRAE
jgi:hypothetical protein